MTRRRKLLAATFLGSVFSAAAPAYADSADFWVTGLSNSVITVESSIDEYTGVTSANLISGTIKVELDAGASGRVEFWSAWPRLGWQDNDNPNGAAGWGNFQTSGQSESYSFPRPKDVNTEFLFSITPAQYGSAMVSACESHADKLRSQGMGNTEIFGADRWIQVAVIAGGDYEMNGIEGNPLPSEVTTWPNYKKVNVICKGDPVELDPAAPAISAAYLSVNIVQPTQFSDVCEMKINGSVISQSPNQEVKFRYVDDEGTPSDLKTVTTNAEGTVAFDHSYPLDAEERKSGKIRMVGHSPPFFSNWADFEVDCTARADDLQSVLPPEAFHLEAIATADTVMHQGLVCPANAKIYGLLKGRGTASGAAALFADDQLKTLKQYSIEDGETIIVEGDYEFDWQAAGASQQNVKFAMNVSNKVGDLIDQIEKTQNFACRRAEVTGVGQGAAGGYSTGKPDPLQSQQARRPAAAGGLMVQPGPAFAIQAPKGRVRQGQIQLSGAQPTGKYDLRFYRKTESGYRMVRSAQLPRQMTGTAASFDLRALTGSQSWRLEVCPAGSRDKKVCETADFQLPPVRGAGKVEAPGGESEPTRVFIVPGINN